VTVWVAVWKSVGNQAVQLGELAVHVQHHSLLEFAHPAVNLFFDHESDLRLRHGVHSSSAPIRSLVRGFEFFHEAILQQ
jgi:hypothetical protein